jgi:pSer/pThr/pTyr-binding forkhead associated (FHA) protein
LIPVEGGLQVVDMESRNGVVVNGKAVKETVLPHRGVFRIGESVFSFLEKGTFSTDAGLLGKFGGRGAESETRSVNTAELRQLIEGEIKAANGDLGKAALNLGVDVSFLEAMLHDTIPPDA